MTHPAAPLNILVVDDSISIIKSLAKILELQGQQVATACNAIDALRMVENGRFDLAICDIEMPGMSGLSFLEKIKQSLDYAMDVILMTGYLESEYYIQAIRLGAADFIRKPIDAKELTASLQRVREKRSRLIGQSEFFYGLHGFEMQFFIDPARYVKTTLDKAFSFFFDVNLGLTHSQTNELLICIDEMIYNATIHGMLQLRKDQRHFDDEQIRTLVAKKKEGLQGRSGIILMTMKLDREQKTITISVEDEGDGFDFQAWMDKLELASEINLSSSGRGIVILKHFSDSISFEKNGSKVSITKALN